MKHLSIKLLLMLVLLNVALTSNSQDLKSNSDCKITNEGIKSNDEWLILGGDTLKNKFSNGVTRIASNKSFVNSTTTFTNVKVDCDNNPTIRIKKLFIEADSAFVKLFSSDLKSGTGTYTTSGNVTSSSQLPNRAYLDELNYSRMLEKEIKTLKVKVDSLQSIINEAEK